VLPHWKLPLFPHHGRQAGTAAGSGSGPATRTIAETNDRRRGFLCRRAIWWRLKNKVNQHA
jgi:hypothetical protein